VLPELKFALEPSENVIMFIIDIANNSVQLISEKDFMVLYDSK
jgi:extradiol dioxygenase family protein